MKTKLIFCANEQKITKHILTVDNIGEIVATCDCERFVKFPVGLDVKKLEGLIENHEKKNTLSEEALEVEKARKESEQTLELITD